MKMVILGARAPNCEKKPQNPTASSAVGTMSGQSAAQKQGTIGRRGVTAQEGHRPQYQGMLQAPRLSEIFDHQLIKSNIDNPALTGNPAISGNQLEGSEAVRGSALFRSETAKAASSALGQVQGIFQGGFNANVTGNGFNIVTETQNETHAKSAPKYHYQKFIPESSKSYGALPVGLRPGQKTIKQQREMAQLRFYQTLTNQPYLTNQNISKGAQQPVSGGSQVKMLSQMRSGLLQQPGLVARNGHGPGSNTSHLLSGGNNESVSEALKSLEGAWATQQKDGQPLIGHVQSALQSGVGSLDAFTTAGYNKFGGRSQLSGMPPQIASDRVKHPTIKVAQGMKGPKPLEPSFDTVKALVQDASAEQVSAKRSQQLGATELNSNVADPAQRSELVLNPDDKENMDFVGSRGGITPKNDATVPGTVSVSRQNFSTKALHEHALINQSGSARDVKQHGPKSVTGKQPGLSPIRSRGKGISDVLNAPIHQNAAKSQTQIHAEGLRFVQQSAATIPQQETRRHSDPPTEASKAPQNEEKPPVHLKDDRSLTRGNRDSLGKLGDEGPRSNGSRAPEIRVSKIEKHQSKERRNFKGITSEDDHQRADRFSSKGQEELLKAYQRPSGQAGMDGFQSAAAFKGLQANQHRNATAYGGQRQMLAGTKGRKNDNLKHSQSGVPGPRHHRVGSPNYGPERQSAHDPSEAYPIDRAAATAYSSQNNKGFSTFLVKTCSLQSRVETSERREKIRTAYTITQAGKYGMGVLPFLGQKVSQGSGGGLGQPEGVIESLTASRGGSGIVSASTRAKKGPESQQLVPLSVQNPKSALGRVVARLSSKQPHHCQRFMDRGNKPVPQNLEIREHADLSDGATTTALVPFGSNEVGQDQGEVTQLAERSQDVQQSRLGRQVVYGELELGNFDEEISGINLSKLFSVYGPQSAEGKRRKLASKAAGKVAEKAGKSQESRKPMILQQPKMSPHIFPMNKKELTGPAAPTVQGISSKYDANSPSNANKSELLVAGITASDQQRAPQGDGAGPRKAAGLEDSLPASLEDAQQSHEDDSDYTTDEDEEPLIIQLMESMFTRKKTVQETEQMISKIDLEAIREEIRRLALDERARIERAARSKVHDQTVANCERLQALIARGNPDYSESAFEKPYEAAKANPFFQALDAQKKERSKYKQMLELAVQHSEDLQEDSLRLEHPDQGDFAALGQQTQTEEDGGDIFKHTFVDVPEAEPSSDSKSIRKPTAVVPRQKDILFFYNFSFDLPSAYYKQLGDFTQVNEAQARAMRDLLLRQWPVLRGKKVQFKAAFEATTEAYNVVLLGKDCPLSKCCKMTIYFQFTREVGGRAICMESLCALNPLDHFQVDPEIKELLYGDNQEGPGQQNSAIGSRMINDTLGTLSKDQYKRLRPIFKKIVSQEISKLVSKGNHRNLSIRSLMKNSNIEQKALSYIQGLRKRSPATGESKKLAIGDLMHLLYESSSLQSSAPGTVTEREGQEQNANDDLYFKTSFQQPHDSINSQYATDNNAYDHTLERPVDQLKTMVDHFATSGQQEVASMPISTQRANQMQDDMINAAFLDARLFQQNGNPGSVRGQSAILYSHAYADAYQNSIGTTGNQVAQLAAHFADQTANEGNLVQNTEESMGVNYQGRRVDTHGGDMSADLILGLSAPGFIVQNGMGNFPMPGTKSAGMHGGQSLQPGPPHVSSGVHGWGSDSSKSKLIKSGSPSGGIPMYQNASLVSENQSPVVIIRSKLMQQEVVLQSEAQRVLVNAGPEYPDQVAQRDDQV